MTPLSSLPPLDNSQVQSLIHRNHLNNVPVAFVDGSFNRALKRYGSGVVFYLPPPLPPYSNVNNQHNNKPIKHAWATSGSHPAFVPCHSAAGELLAVLEAVRFAKQHDHPQLTIVTDFRVAHTFITSESKPRSEVSKFYIQEFHRLSPHVRTTFEFVKSHTDIPQHDKADRLARRAAGLPPRVV